MRIALVGRAYTGKTTIAQELGRRGFFGLGFSNYLKMLATDALNSTGRTVATMEMVLAEKPKYRRYIQEFGAMIGFDADPTWLRDYLGPVRYSDANFVIDCLRSVTQAAVAREFGFKIVGVETNLKNRTLFAGGGEDGFFRVYEADEHPIDGQLDLTDYALDYVVYNRPENTAAEMVTAMLETLNAQQVH